MNKTFVYLYEKDGVKNLIFADEALENEEYVLCSLNDVKVDENDSSVYVFREGVFQFSKEKHFVRVV